MYSRKYTIGEGLFSVCTQCYYRNYMMYRSMFVCSFSDCSLTSTVLGENLRFSGEKGDSGLKPHKTDLTSERETNTEEPS